MSKYNRPQYRPLKIFAVDPMQGRTVGNRVTIDVENERLQPGPVGERIEVIDYDGAHKRYYPPVNLDDPNLLMQSGMDPSESDPRFHQQMVYAVAMRTLQNFDRALGRRINLRGRARPRLRIYPHAFYGANAFYDRDLHALLFGYFRADKEKPGRNLPGQTIFTCLSHDIVAHEMTHAIVDRLRKYFRDPSNEDVPAFHEAFSDIVALFQHFTYRELLREQMQQSAGDIRKRSTLVELAGQFGQATGTGRALRCAIDEADPMRIQTAVEPHDRGSILVSAVFDAFFNTYERRTRDLIRIATGGSGKLPEGHLHPDLVNRIASEAARAAQQLLSMCIRAFDYLPPVDITFGDYLRALVTADYELSPDDEWGQRAALIEAFRLRGIYPGRVVSLAEESLLWEPAPADCPPLDILEETDLLYEYVTAATEFSRNRVALAEPESPKPTSKFQAYKQQYISQPAESVDESRAFYKKLHAYANAHRARLFLDPLLNIEVGGAHTVFRVSPTGQLLIEFIAQFVQSDVTRQEEFGGLPLRGGTTLVASWDGTVRYIIPKPLPYANLAADMRERALARIEKQHAYVSLCDAIDLSSSYLSDEEYARRMAARSNLRALHEGF